jgi:hypothetical protein
MPRADYGQAIVSPGYVRRVWTPLFELRGYHEARFAQTVIVCRRTA